LPPYDGTLHITPDSHAGERLSLLFRHQRSGFEGGLIFQRKPISGADASRCWANTTDPPQEGARL